MQRVRIFLVVLVFTLAASVSAGQVYLDVQTLLFNSKSGVSYKITGLIESKSPDTVRLEIEDISSGEGLMVQTLKIPCSIPLEITEMSLSGQSGLFIKYDVADRNGNGFLYLFNESGQAFHELQGFRKLGAVKTVEVNDKKFHYAYRSCGCADACWKSILFEIVDLTIETNASISCDCEKLAEQTGNMELAILGDCEEFNNAQKFERLERYWIDKIKSDR